MCFIRVKSAGHCTVSGWSLTTPSGHRTVPGRASADDIIYRRRPPPVRYVTTQMFLKIGRCPDGYQIRGWCEKPLKSYVASFICDHSIICVPIVVVAQCLERSPCMLIVYDCLYCVDFYLTFRCSTHNCFLDFSYSYMNVCIIVHNDGEYRQMVMLHAYVIAII